MSLTDNGYHKPTYDEILANKIQTAKELFGDDIATGEQTALGKFIRIGAKDLATAYEDIEAVYYARFPNTASGISLDRLSVFAGISRNPATLAYHKIKVYGNEGATVDEIVVCGEDSEITFHNISSFTIGTPTSENTLGYAEIIVECDTAGTVGNMTITDIVNPIADVDHIEYVGLETAGENTESDYSLRKRFAQAIEGAGSTNANAIRAAILRVPNVVSVGIAENNTDSTDDSGRPPHSFECYVYGQNLDNQQIAQAIFDKSPIGIKSCSTSTNPISVSVIDDGGFSHTVNFSYTENVNVYIKISIKTNSDFESDGITQIKNVLTSYIDNLGVGTDVILSTLYGKIYSVAGIEDVTKIELSTDGTTYSAANIVVDNTQVANTAAARITITEVIT